MTGRMVTCACGHSFGSHTVPSGRCLLAGCGCKEFTRAIRRRALGEPGRLGKTGRGSALRGTGQAPKDQR